MRTLVTHENLEQVISRLLQVTGVVGFDTETYGLKWNDKMFSLQLCTENNESFYFNFHDYKDGATPTLDREILTRLNPLFANSNIRWVAHNAKFDLRRLEIDGIKLNGEVYDTMSMAHIEYNKHMSYSLDSCLKRIGKEKNSKVELWIRDNKAYTTYLVEGKKTKEKDLHYDRVPFDIMFEYGLDDVELTLELYRHQTKFFEENPDQIALVHNELQLIKAVYEMESTGIAVDVGYCNKMYVKELKTQREIVKHIEKLTDKEFKNGPKWLSSVLQEQGIELHTTEKGNASLGKKELSSMNNAIPQLILEMRDAEKRATAFYAPLQRMADKGIIHPSYRLTGTDTGRFSCSDPNIQQIPKQEKETGDTVRQAFIPRPGYFFLSIDYDQMEYRIMADYAGETNMISAIKSGLDPHTYVANMMGVDRKTAKTLNFGRQLELGRSKTYSIQGNPKWAILSESSGDTRSVQRLTGILEQDTAAYAKA